MRCSQFVRLWNERLDATSLNHGSTRAESSHYGDHILESHSAVCADCRQLSVNFAALERGLAAGYSLPKPTPGLERRILVTWHDQFAQPSRPRAIWLTISDLWSVRRTEFRIAAGVAALFFSTVLGAKMIDRALEIAKARERIELAQRRLITDNINTSALKPEGVPTLNQALATASEATWILARSASQPAASIGREFAAAAIPDAFPTTNVNGIVPDPSAASSALERISGQVVQGAKPLSSAARRAFSFLSLPSTENNPARRAIAPVDKRA